MINKQFSAFPEMFLSIFTAAVRQELTKKMLDSGEMDQNFRSITISFDGTHRLWTKTPSYREPNDWSYKLKDSGYNVMVLFTIYLINNY